MATPEIMVPITAAVLVAVVIGYKLACLQMDRNLDDAAAKIKLAIDGLIDDIDTDPEIVEALHGLMDATCRLFVSEIKRRWNA